MQRLTSSFRDPSGFVFLHKGIVRRKILPGYFEQFNGLIESGLYQKLVDRKLLIAHQVIESDPDHIIIEPQQIEFISYPYEWPFGLLKDAALLTLKIASELSRFICLASSTVDIIDNILILCADICPGKRSFPISKAWE